MKPEIAVGFQFTVIWFDEGTIELCISAWNGNFGGTIEVYEAHGKLEKAAGSLVGFPLTPSEKREIVFVNFDHKWAGGGVRMRFHCVDGAGHAYVEAEMDSNYESGGNDPDRTAVHACSRQQPLTHSCKT
jgi:hypothetical protein